MVRIPSSRLEQLKELLQEEQPDRQAVQVIVDELMSGDGGALGMLEAKKVLSRLLMDLIRPVFSGSVERQAAVDDLVAQVRKAGSLGSADISRRLAEIGSWLASATVDGPDGAHGGPSGAAPGAGAAPGGEALPANLPESLMAVLRILGESEPWIIERTDLIEAERREKGAVQWPEIHQFLEKIAAHEALTRAMWRQERELLKGVMVDVAGGMSGAMEVIGSVGDGLGTMAQRLRDTDNLDNIKAMRAALLDNVTQFQEHARTLRTQLEESRKSVMASQEKLRRLDQTLAETRDQQLMDPETRVPNRYAFSGHFRRCLERGAHLQGPFTLAVLQLKQFHEAMRRLGRERENRLVKALGKRMRQELDRGDFFARLGPEQFVLLFPEADLAAAQVRVEKVREMLDHTRFRLGGGGIMLQSYFGMVQFGPGMTENDMLHKASWRAMAALEEGRRGARIMCDDALAEPP